MPSLRTLLLPALIALAASGCQRQGPPGSVWESSPAVKGVELAQEDGRRTLHVRLRPRGGDDAARFLGIAAGDMRDVLQALHLYLPQEQPQRLVFTLEAPLVSRSGNSALVKVMRVSFDWPGPAGIDWRKPPEAAALLAGAGEVLALEPVADKIMAAYCQQLAAADKARLPWCKSTP